MSSSIDGTHDANLKSWVVSANEADTDFPIQNLPFGIFRRHGDSGAGRTGVAIGDQILDLKAASSEGFVNSSVTTGETLNTLMGLDSAKLQSLRSELSHVLQEDSLKGGRLSEVASRILVPMSEAEMLLPANIGDYTDFYASIYHATNTGRRLRPENPLMPNYKWIPIGYHGRASSIVVSGTPVMRPSGQTKANHASAPSFGPTRALDYELEVGCFIGTGNSLGQTIAMSAAEDHIFGYCLLNDWSARDVQRWEYQPLGPFLAKNFATTVSPWVTTSAALAPFRVPAFERPESDPQPLEYLDSGENRQKGGLDITLEVFIQTAQMRDHGIEPFRLCRSNARHLYWTFAQMVVHHTSSGCNLRTGDVVGSGTISGNTPDSVGSLLELSDGGARPITLPSGETRRFLQDGDEVIYRARCQRPGFRSIGFGECRGRIRA
jgi:fumarylacetoacetase